MFSLLTNSFRKNITCYNCFHRTAFTHRNCNNRVSETYKRYNFDHRKVTNLDVNREVNIDKRDNEDYNGHSSQGWKLSSRYLIALGLLSYCLAKNQINAEGKDEEEYETGIPLIVDNLPCDTPYYMEISNKKRELEEDLKNKKIVVISGAGGMGKSTLAGEYAREYKNNGYQVRWIEGTQIEKEILKLAQEMNINVEGLDPEIIKNLVYREFEKINKPEGVLLIFDNIEKEENIARYIENFPRNSKIIITTRNSRLLNNIESIEMEGFSKEEAKKYIYQVLGENEKAIEELIATVGVLPFRLSRALIYLKEHNLMGIAEYIKKYKLIALGEKEDEKIYPEVELLFKDLKEECYGGWKLIKYLGYLELEGIEAEFIADLIGEEIQDLEKYIDYLKKLSLIKTEFKKDKITIKLSHKIVQDEIIKATIHEDKNQVKWILKSLVKKVDERFPEVNENPENWRLAVEWMNHIRPLTNDDQKDILKETRLFEKLGTCYQFIYFDYQKAIQYLNKALELCNNTKQEEAIILNKIGHSYRNLGGEKNIYKGLKYYKESLKIAKELPSENNFVVADSLNNIGRAYQQLGGEKNIHKGLGYHKESLKIFKELFPGDHLAVATSLNYIGEAYRKLRGGKNIHNALKYYKRSLKMRRKLFPQNHPAIAQSLNSIGGAYEKLGGEQNIYRGLEYYEESLKIRRELFSGDHPVVADSLNNIGGAYRKLRGEENTRKALEYYKKSLKMRRKLFSGDHHDIAGSLNNIGMVYQALKGKDNIDKALTYHKKALQMRRVLFSQDHFDVAGSLNNIGMAYLELGGEENKLKGLEYCEDALKIYQVLFPNGHPHTALCLESIAVIYLDFHDYNKALEYCKQAYGISCTVMDRDSEELKEIRYKIAFLQPNFFQENPIEIQFKEKKDYLGGNIVESECRWIILSRGKFDHDVLLLKQKIQRDVLNEIGNAVKVHGWDYKSFLWINWGVKGYLDKTYLLIKLENLANDKKNLETAQMLCFEAMNLGIMKSIKDSKPYEIAEIFTKEYPELVKKIAIEHPEFFVDGSIVEACVRAMSDLESKEFILEHVKYIGMKERRNAGLIDVLLKRDE